MNEKPLSRSLERGFLHCALCSQSLIRKLFCARQCTKDFEKELIVHGSVILSEAKNLWPFNLQAEILRRLLLLRMTK